VKRRTFITTALASAAALAATRITGEARESPRLQAPPPPGGKRFRLNYAPSFGQFKAHAGTDLAAQVQFAADEGFTAMFDNGLMNRPVADQELIVREIQKRNMKLGPFVLLADFNNKNFVTRDKEVRAALLQKMRDGIETMKRTGVGLALVVPGRFDESLAWEYQTANVVDNLRACMDLCQPAGLVIVLEPLNPKNHPGLFLSRIPQAYQICRSVNSPSCKIVNDIYHQQITRATSSRTSKPAGTRSPRSTWATTPGARSRRPARSTTATCSSTFTAGAIRASCAWSTARASRARRANAPSSTRIARVISSRGSR